MKRAIVCLFVCLMMSMGVSGLRAQEVPTEPETPTKAGPVAVPAQAGMVRLLRYSNRVVDALGQPRTGQVGMTFALYPEQEGGTPLWLETQNVELDEEGRYTALLGITSNDGLPLESFSTEEARWLGIQVQGEVEQPRVLLVSVPYALKAADAEMLGGKPLSAFVLAEPAAGTGSAGAEPGEVPIDDPNALIDGSGTTNFVAKFTSSTNIGNSQIFDNGTNVGIGTSGPADKLQVNGNIRLIGQTTHQVQMNGAASAGRLGQDANGFFFTSDTAGKLLSFFTNAGAGIQRRLTIAGDGNVGIGTGTPSQLLHLQKDGSNHILMTCSGFCNAVNSGTIDFLEDPGPFGADANGGFRLTYDGNANNFFVHSGTSGGTATHINMSRGTGRVGIGFASPDPAARLDVRDSTFLVARFENDGTGGDDTVLVDMVNAGDAMTWRYGVAGTGNGLGIAAGRFYLERVGNGAQMVLDGSGRVGIGTTTPSGRLEVAGVQPFINLNDTSGGTRLTGILFQKNGTTGWRILTDPGGFDVNRLAFNDAVARVTRMQIEPGGQVGIGTTTPDSTAGLHVVPGKIRFGSAEFIEDCGADCIRIGSSGSGSAFGTLNVQDDLNVVGTLTKGSGSFKIDHPLDPAHKYLYHSFVESPDMMNVYNGNIVLDENGEAMVELPEWFQALNADFRYQLTTIGGFAPVYVAEEISHNRFTIAGGRPGLKVSWQVTGIRQDAYARENRIPVEEDKAGHERGYFLYPAGFGQSPDKHVSNAPRPAGESERKAEVAAGDREDGGR